jgi:hypothetical protein
MGFRKPPESDLERELRAARPQPREEYLQALAREIGGPKPEGRRAPGRMLPRLALVAVVTVVLAASLGVAGALGHATGSIKSLGEGIYHVFHAPGNANGEVVGDPHDDNDHNGRLPFHVEYDHYLPICHDGTIAFIPTQAFIPLVVAGHGHWRAPLFHPLRCR